MRKETSSQKLSEQEKDLRYYALVTEDIVKVLQTIDRRIERINTELSFVQDEKEVKGYVKGKSAD